jgi:hypothetical protein
MSKAVSLSEILAALQFGDLANLEGCERLPILSEQDELDLALRFVETREKAEDRQRLNLALREANPQEAFETAVFRCQIAHAWFQFRDEQLLQRAKNWLDAEGLAYIDDVTPHAD